MNLMSSSTILFILWLIITPMSLTWTTTTFIEWNILPFEPTPIHIPIILDQSGLLFSSAIIFISANVMKFAKQYMADENHKTRFSQLVLLFVLSMNLLVFIPHMISLLIGWDGLGLVSFLLVIFYQNPKSLGAGMITVLSNRVGDAMLILSIAWSLNMGHWSIVSTWDSSVEKMITIALMLAAMTKSAQMPFSSWLPAAMAAPTPVSALVHSSTLVTAGVFLLIRFSPMLYNFHMFTKTLMIISSMTMLMAGYTALAETDMKKIIALSTLSQLGVMMFTLSIKAPQLTMFHLLTHAMFKALLFICAGTIISTNSHAQDLRLLGNLSPQMPTTTACMTIANMALAGSPFLSGFYSKDLVIELMLSDNKNIIPSLMMMIATMMTAAYSTRFTMLTMLSPPQMSPSLMTNEKSNNFILPMLMLTIKAVTVGAILSWTLVAPSHPTNLPLQWKTTPVMLMLTGLVSMYLMYSWMTSLQRPLKSLHMTHFSMTSMWALTPISTQSVSMMTLMTAKAINKSTDTGWSELLGPQGSLNLLTSSTSKLPLMKSLPLTAFTSSIPIIMIILMMIMCLSY